MKTKDTHDTATENGLLQPGRNCWVVTRAKRLSVLVDGQDYFRFTHRIINQAQRQVLFLAWDIDTQFEMVRGKDVQRGVPSALGAFLDYQTRTTPTLDIYVLSWDFTPLFAHARELLPQVKFKIQTSDRVHFQLDDTAPNGGSHHQKILVVDDEIAFCGGLDFTKGRWDTHAHAPDDPLRTDPKGRPQRPYHDMSMMVQGEAAAALGDLARERNRVAGGQPIAPPAPPVSIAWPEDVVPLMENVPVAISRTWIREDHEIKETLQLTLDLIGACREFLYIENQYLTSQEVAEALETLLTRTDNPPEVVIVLTPHSDGWIAKHTMDVLRSRLIHRLKKADIHGRLSIYVPHISEMADTDINVHAKLMIVDDRFVRVGSTNLANRSMHLDTECDLTADATETQSHRRAIARFRDERIGEHVGLTADEVAVQRERFDSIKELIDFNRQRDTRCLLPIEPILISPDAPDFTNPAIYDPRDPIDYDTLSQTLLGHTPAQTPVTRILVRVGIVLAIAGVVGIWHWPPLAKWISVAEIRNVLSSINVDSTSALLVMGIMIAGELLMIPVTVIVIAAMLVFGPYSGVLYSYLSILISASIGFGAGRLLGTHTLRDLMGRRANRISRALARRGIFASIAIRVVPIAPFAAINLMAGASHVRFRDYIVGTAVGHLPSLGAFVFIATQLQLGLNDPRNSIIVGSASVIAAIGIGLYLLIDWQKRRPSAKNAVRGNHPKDDAS